MDTGGIKQLKERKGRRYNRIGDITEYLKKKRDREENKNGEESAFRSSKIVMRSPQTGEEKRMQDREEWERNFREEVRKDITAGLKILGEEIREEIKDSITRQGETMLGDMKMIREELRERERKWEEEKGELREIIKNLEGKVEKLSKKGEEREIEGEERNWREGRRRVRIKIVERKIEWKDREDRKKNIVIRRVEMEKGDARRGVEQVIEKLGVDITIEKVRKVGTTREEQW